MNSFEVPLVFVMDAANHKRASRDWKGVTRHYYEMPFGERYIWGVTAGILRNLLSAATPTRTEKIPVPKP